MHQLPKVDKYDLSFIACDEAKEYVLMLQNKDVQDVLKWNKRVPQLDTLKQVLNSNYISEGLKSILKNLLQLNPYFRWTSKECLSNSYFDDVRVAASEIPTKVKIQLVVDKDGSFNYEENLSQMFTQNDYQNIILKEVKEINLKRAH